MINRTRTAAKLLTLVVVLIFLGLAATYGFRLHRNRENLRMRNWDFLWAKRVLAEPEVFFEQPKILDARKTSIVLLDSGTSIAEKSTMIRVTNPRYTKALAREVWATEFDGNKPHRSMVKHGYKKIEFSNGKASWAFSLKTPSLDS